LSTTTSPDLIHAQGALAGTASKQPAKTRHIRKTRPALASVGAGSKPLRAVGVVLATIWLVFVLVPIYYMILTSFRSESQYLSANPWLPTGGLSTSSYSAVFQGSGIATDFRNSAEFAAGTIALVVGLSLAAAWRIVTHPSRFGRLSFRLLLAGLAIPIQAIVIPIFVIVVKLHIYDKLYTLVLVTAASLCSVSVLLMVSYVRGIPRELFDAMRVDGASEWTIFLRLVVPMSRPIIATVSIYAGLGAWNNFLLPLILTQSNNDTVLPLGLFKFSTASEYGVNVPVVMAAVLLSVLPLLALYIGLRRQFVKGLGGLALQ
jgi:ABC-type glycerol-3-phosphate transport system permease component